MIGLRRKTNVRKVSLRRRVTEAWTRLRAGREPEHVADDDEGEGEVDAPAGSRLLGSRLLGLGAAALCLGLVAFVLLHLDEYTARTQQFHVAQFDVGGAGRTGRDAVIAATGVRPGSSLMAVDLGVVRRNVELLPWVRHARVQTALPSTLAVQVTEYQPFALALGAPSGHKAGTGRDKASTLYVVDRAGHVFKELAAGEAIGLPIVTGVPVALRREGVEPADADAARHVHRLQQLLQLIAAHGWSPVAQRFPLSEVHDDPVLGVTLISATDGAEVRLGRQMQADLDRAFTQVARLLGRVEERGQWLKYALLDDDVRLDRAVVHAVPLEQGAGSALAGGAASEPLPSEPPAVEPKPAAKPHDAKKPAAAAAAEKPAGDGH